MPTHSLLLQLIRWDKPVGTMLLLLPTLAALFVASGAIPSGRLLLIFAAGCFITRSLGCIVNDIFDRELDARVARTRERPLASGKLSLKAAILFAILLAACALWLLYLLPKSTWVAGAIGALLLTVYPLAKRYLAWPQLVLGFAFSWGVIMVWASIPSADTLAPIILLFFGTFAWIQAYDTIYALCDRQDDYDAGINSSALVLGDSAPHAIAGLHLLALGCWSALGYLLDADRTFWSFLVLAAATQVHQLYTIFRFTDEGSKLLASFTNNGYTGSFVLLAIASLYWPA